MAGPIDDPNSTPIHFEYRAKMPSQLGDHFEQLVHGRTTAWMNGTVPDGFIAIVDAEMDLVCLVPIGSGNAEFLVELFNAMTCVPVWEDS